MGGSAGAGFNASIRGIRKTHWVSGTGRVKRERRSSTRSSAGSPALNPSERPQLRHHILEPLHEVVDVLRGIVMAHRPPRAAFGDSLFSVQYRSWVSPTREDLPELRVKPRVVFGDVRPVGDPLYLSRPLGVKMDTLMRMQASYDIARTRQREGEISIEPDRPSTDSASIRAETGV